MSAFSGNIHGVVIICWAIVAFQLGGVAPKSVAKAAKVTAVLFLLFWLWRLMTGFYGPPMEVLRPLCG